VAIPNTGGVPSRAFMSIGEVLSQLRPEFADVTISKIRFLEDEGLIKPVRTASGYRKFSREDVGRLRYVLGMGGGGPMVPLARVAAEGMPGPDAFRPDASEIRLSRRELLDAAGLEPLQLEQLEQYGLIGPRPGGSHYDGNALIVAKTVAEMARFGIEARHLRPFKAAAEREIGLVEQVVTPLVRQRNPEARARADEVARELASLSVKLHATLVKSGLAPGLRRYGASHYR
jgi:hypothetical protein